MVWKTALLALVVVAVLAGAAYFSMAALPTGSTTTSTSTSSCTTVTSSSMSSTSSTTSSSSSSTSGSTSSSSSTSSTASSITSSTSTSTSNTNTTYGSFTYSPALPVVVDSVAAITSVHSDGFTYVTFQVLYTNGGNSPIYVIGGCGGGLTSTIEGNSSVLLRTTGGPLCDCAAYIVTLEHGQNNTSVGPGCWSGYYYRLVGHGTVTMNLTLGWSSNGQNFNQSNSTDIQAEFTF